MQLLIIFIIYTIICLILTYYFHLFVSQSVYTKNEIKDILPQLGNILGRIYTRYSIFILMCFYILSGFTGIIILTVFENWILNSALLPFIAYMTGPRLAVYFEQTRVTITEDYNDILEILYTRYYNYILTGFFSGCFTQLLDNWINKGVINFYWFLLNISLITGFSVLIFKKDIFDI